MDAFPEVLSHVKGCILPIKHCHMCSFAKRRQEQFPWLTLERSGFGCSSCKKAGVCSTWAKQTVPLLADSVRHCNLKRHENSFLHIHALKKEDVVNGVVTPPISDFEEALQLLTEGNLSVRLVASRLKTSRIVVEGLKETLTRAMLASNRAYLMSPGTVLTLHVDARAHVLAIRFSGCNDALECRHGLLGVVDMRPFNDANAGCLKQAVLSSFHTCVGEENMPAFRGRVEIYNADAAPDEQLCGRMIQGRKLVDRCFRRFGEFFVVGSKI